MVRTLAWAACGRMFVSVRTSKPVQGRRAVSELQALIADLHVVSVTDDLVATAADLADSEGLRSARYPAPPPSTGPT